MDFKKPKYLIFIFVLILSCDYVRKQRIPNGVHIESHSLVGSKNIYNIYRYKLSDLSNSDLNSWNKNLICEGYSDQSMRIDWHEYYLNNTENPLTYFYDTLLEFREDTLTFNKNFFVGGCKTEWVTDSNSKLNTTYHVVYFLDKETTNLIEIRSVD